MNMEIFINYSYNFFVSVKRIPWQPLKGKAETRKKKRIPLTYLLQNP